MIHSNSLTRQVGDYIRKNPGSARALVLTALPEGTKPQSISSIMSHLARTGVIENRGGAGRAARWYPVVRTVGAMYRKIARDILSDMKGVHHTQREEWLAQRLQDTFSSGNN